MISKGRTSLGRIARAVGAASVAALVSIADDALAVCTTDPECADGLFCNGNEQCVPGAFGADARGCVAATSGPCRAGQRCDEKLDRCVAANCRNDDDGDGVVSTACGGFDCDDADVNRFPGNTEICDVNARDEDCNPETFGETDADGDRFVASTCCNQGVSGTNCGSDCSDAESSIHPAAPEICDTQDNDCDGSIDEHVQLTLHHDRDHDGYGDHRDSVLGCAETIGLVANDFDCDDRYPHIAAGAMICFGEGQPNLVRICRQETFGPDLVDDACAPGAVCQTQPNLRGVCLGDTEPPPEPTVTSPPPPSPTPTSTTTATATATPTPGLTCLQCLQDPTCPAPCSESNVGCVCFAPPPI